MPEPLDQKTINDELRQWHYWWLVVFSLLLIITFVYYLPLRFLHQASQDTEHHADTHVLPVYQETYDIQQGLSVDLFITPDLARTGEEVTLDFFVNQKPGGIPVLINNLDIVHARTMHVLVVRSDMNEFSHIHPVLTATPGVLSVKHVFQKPGRYKIWADVTMESVNYVFGQHELVVEGEGEIEQKQVSFEKSAGVEGYRVVMRTSGQVEAGSDVGVAFNVYDSAGQKIKVENYLEAPMHLAIIKDDWRQLIHAHPVESMMNDLEGMEHMMDENMGDHEHGFLQLIHQVYADEGHADTASSMTALEGDIAFSVMFPEAGLYKLYAQFRPQGIDLSADEAFTATFWLEVTPEISIPPAPVSPSVMPVVSETIPVPPQNTPTPQSGHYHPPGTTPHVDAPVQTTTFTSIGIDSWWVLLIMSLILIVLLSKYVKKYIGEET